MNNHLTLLKRLFAAFPRQPVSEETVALYAEQLLGVPEGHLAAAVRDCIRNCEYLPSVAEILNHLDPEVMLRTPQIGMGPCPICKGMRFVYHDVVPEHYDFGKAFYCTCWGPPKAGTASKMNARVNDRG